MLLLKQFIYNDSPIRRRRNSFKNKNNIGYNMWFLIQPWFINTKLYEQVEFYISHFSMNERNATLCIQRKQGRHHENVNTVRDKGHGTSCTHARNTHTPRSKGNAIRHRCRHLRPPRIYSRCGITDCHTKHSRALNEAWLKFAVSRSCTHTSPRHKTVPDSLQLERSRTIYQYKTVLPICAFCNWDSRALERFIVAASVVPNLNQI